MKEGQHYCVFDVGSAAFLPMSLEGTECIQHHNNVLGTITDTWVESGRVFVGMWLPFQPEWGLEVCMIGSYVFLSPTTRTTPHLIKSLKI